VQHQACGNQERVDFFFSFPQHLSPPALHDTHLIRLLADNGPNDPAGPPHTHTHTRGSS
jgi:hypothetical protein